MNKRLNLAIIDSGVSLYDFSKENIFTGYSIFYDEEKKSNSIVCGECKDEIGHGTAIVDIINKNINGICIDMYKIYQEKFETYESTLIDALFEISKKNYDVLHISSGTVQPNSYQELYSICNKIADSGTIIISAFDNDGSVSYPAAFPFVIGVDLSDNKLKKQEYEYVENSIVNLRVSSSFHRVRWINQQVLLLQGSSFSSVYVTVEVLQIMKNGIKDFEEIMCVLKNKAVNIYEGNLHKRYNSKFVEKINRAIIFPFNKEIHSVIRYRKELPFEIIGIYDCKYTLKVGRKICDIEESIDEIEIIQDVNKIKWDGDFDTLILGHTEKLFKLTGIDYKNELLQKCKTYNKQVFSMDKVNKKFNNVYFPKATFDMVPQNRFGKMRYITKPVLGIWGTSSQQGKFTLQMKLRNELIDMGYKVGILATEPQAALFLADRVFPIGYNSTVEITDIQTVSLLNEYMWEIDCLDCDIIIVGSQSGTVPFDFKNLSLYPVYQYDMLVGTQPDYVILCVNLHDEYSYIERTIKFIEGSIDTKVIGLVIYPIALREKDIGGNLQKQIISDDEMKMAIMSLENEFNIRVYSLNSELITRDIVEIFSKADYDEV